VFVAEAYLNIIIHAVPSFIFW